MTTTSGEDDAHRPDRDRSAAFANAYAITYRLLGVRDLATRAAATVAARYASKEGEPPPQWLPDVAHDAVDESLAADSDSALDAVKDASSRAALRRRLNGAGGATWVAVALHHLAGYSISDTAALMTYDEQTVAELCGPFDPPPGEQWADLGDPTLRAGDRVARDRRGRRRIPVFPLVAVALVAALAIWAATSIGDRPTVTQDTAGTADDDGGAVAGDAPVGAAPDVTPDDSGTAFSPALDPLASAGCANTDTTAGTETRELTVDDSPTTFTLTTPEVEDPAPLVVGIADDAQGVESFRQSTGLEQSLPSSIHATLESTSGDARSVGMNAVPAIIEDVLTTFCVDLRRVTVVGFGTGAEAAGDAACSSPDLVVGFAMVDGMRAAEGCRLDPSASIFIAAADDDPGVDTGTALEEIGSSWADLLDAASDQVDGRDEETLVRTWVGPGDVRVTTVSSIEGGHTWTTADTNDVTEFITNTARRIE